PLSVPAAPASGLSVSQWCPPTGAKDGVGCVTQAIESQWALLRDKTRPPADRATALRYIIHLVGDTHQPLHDADNNDHGGNCTAMKFLNEDRPTNLHSVWDSKLIQHDMAEHKLDQAGYTSLLTTEFAKRRKKWLKEKINPELWAWQGHTIAVKTTYGLISPAIPVETPGPDACDAERAKVTALKIALGDDYFNRSMPAVREQLAHSAARLAGLLNHSF
ncbi:MAG TPA: S1/P1 nuclease, partial [Bryobacteraceae bacterium]|nr:S1/P1 nuclease [Bryobacteraceae bacterium]